MKKTGITGTIGAGKTTFSILLRRMGYSVFDSDQYAHICLQKTHPAYAMIVSAFGRGILDEYEEIDRKKLAGAVFGKEEKRKQLNAIIHPFVKEGILNFFRINEDKDYAFAEVPLLFEAGWEDLFDEIVVITCSDETAIRRLVEDRGFSREDAEKRLKSQINKKEQCEKADTVFYNDGNIAELNDQIRQWLEGK